MFIRPYKSEDAAAISALRWRAVQIIAPRAYTSEQIQAWLPEPDSLKKTRQRCEDGRDVWVAVSATDDVAGVIDLENDGHIDTLYVDPDYAGKGIGFSLLMHVEQIAQERNLGQLYTEASELAAPVFTRAGFSTTERRDFLLRGISIHNYAMQKALRL
jgi:putative acetyltransferase